VQIHTHLDRLKSSKDIVEIINVVNQLIDLGKIELANWLSSIVQSDLLDYMEKNFNNVEYNSLPIFTQYEAVKTALMKYNTIFESVIKRAIFTINKLFSNWTILSIDRTPVDASAEEKSEDKLFILHWTTPIVMIPQATQYLRNAKTIIVNSTTVSSKNRAVLRSEMVNHFIQNVFLEIIPDGEDTLYLIDSCLTMYKTYRLENAPPNVALEYAIEKLTKF
jgi:hypothetical protein